MSKTVFRYYVYYFKPYCDSMFLAINTPVASTALVKARELHEQGFKVVVHDGTYEVPGNYE